MYYPALYLAKYQALVPLFVAVHASRMRDEGPRRMPARR